MFQKIYSIFHAHYHRRYHGVYNHAKQLFVFDLCLLALSIGMLATAVVLFVWKPTITDQIELTISLGDTRIRSGDDTVLTVGYGNHSKVVLNDVTLAVKFPNGFVLDEAHVPNGFSVSDHTIHLSALRPGGNGTLVLPGTLYTDMATSESILAYFSYVPEGKSEREQKISRFMLALPQSVLSVVATLPSSTFANVPTPFHLTLSNLGSHTLTGVELTSNYPLTTSSTTSGIDLAPGATVELGGTFRLPAGVRDPLRFVTSIEVAHTRLTQTVLERAVEVVAPHVVSSALLRDSVPYIEPGTTVPLTIAWKNDGRVSLRNLQLHIAFTPGTVDLAATAKANKLRLEGTELVADATSRTALASGTPGSSDRFDINVILLPRFSNTTDRAWRAVPSIVGVVENVPGQTYTQAGSAVSVPLATTLSMAAETRYYSDDGDQLGRGPLPPRVGQTTKYWIVITIANGANDVANMSFTTTLPPGVSFTGEQSTTIGPRLTFNPANRTVNWNVKLVPASSQTGLYFEVAVTPTESHVGGSLNLTNSLNVFGTDALVGKEFHLTAPPRTNVLPPKDRGAVKGAAVGE